MTTISRFAAAICTLFATSLTVEAADVHASVPMLNLTAGVVDVLERSHSHDRLRLGVEYRFRAQGSWKLIPAVGYAFAANGAQFVYADLRHDFWMTDRWLLIPSFGLGSFDNGDSIDLGQRLEFRSGLELAYRFHGQYRVGAAFFHLSNGGLSERNPGTEALVMSLCIPLDKL